MLPSRSDVILANLSKGLTVEGQLKTFHIPAALAGEARGKVEMHKRFQEVVATICRINLRRFLERKAEKGKS